MAEASRNSKKPVTTASFLQQFSQSKASPSVAQSSENLLSFIQPIATETPTATNSMEGLSDLDLQTLLQNFKDLCTDEQHSLISYLKKLEAKEPERVERLRKFVNLDNNEKVQEKEPVESNPRSSPFANRLSGMNPIIDEPVEIETKSDSNIEPPVAKVNLDSDDEDYSFEDVFKAAKKNVKEKEERERATTMFKTEDFDLSNAKSLIANIMGQFKASNMESGHKTDNLLGLGKVAPTFTEDANSQQMEHKFRIHDLTKLTLPNIQTRLESSQPLPKVDNNLQFLPEPSPFNRNYTQQNITYPEHNQYMNQPHPINANQPRSHFDQGRASYQIDSVDSHSRHFPVRLNNFDNYGRW